MAGSRRAGVKLTNDGCRPIPDGHSQTPDRIKYGHKHSRFACCDGLFVRRRHSDFSFVEAVRSEARRRITITDGIGGFVVFAAITFFRMPAFEKRTMARAVEEPDSQKFAAKAHPTR